MIKRNWKPTILQCLVLPKSSRQWQCSAVKSYAFFILRRTMYLHFEITRWTVSAKTFEFKSALISLHVSLEFETSQRINRVSRSESNGRRPERVRVPYPAGSLTNLLITSLLRLRSRAIWRFDSPWATFAWICPFSKSDSNFPRGIILKKQQLS